jgi:hypothetical protein
MMIFRVQKDVTPHGFQGRVWRTERAKGNRTVAEFLARNLRTDGRRTNRADHRPAYRVATR